MSATTTNSPPAKGEYPEGGRGFLPPKLRFPEFRGAGDWATERLGTVATICTAKVGNNVCVPMSITSGVGLVSQEEKFGRVIAGDSYKNYLLLKPNEFAYNKSATKEYPEGFLTLYSGSELAAVPNSIFTCFRINGDSPDVRFLNYQFSDNLHGRWLRKFIQVGARANGSLSINDRDLMALPVPVPTGSTSVAEQQKIADCLSSLDELIAAQARKVEVLKTHKKGLMQQIFPREGENKPRFRFPEFQNDSDWEEKRVDELGDVLAGKALAATAPGPLRPYLRTKNVLDGEINLSDVLTMPMTDAEFSRFEVLNGDVLLNEGQTLELVGRASIYRGEFEGRCAMQNQLIRFRAFPSTCREFAAQTFRKCQKDGTFARIATQTTSVAHLGSSRFSALTLLWPPSLHEQQHIASCLSSVDVLITTEIQELDTLKTHKKGLMQQLFPAMDEMRA
ncbi:MAG: restriction endonuclease subunit S [Sphaerotilus natans]